MLSLLMPIRRGGGDFALFARFASRLIEEREFFIRKAIGWVLREASKKRPAIVYAFLAAHRDRVSGLTLREGTKYLTRAERAALGLKATR
jgi:3-methyladenine DNA glycosylase AlkD